VSVVVGYVPDATGYLAITEAARRATWRQTDVVVVNAVDQAGYVRPTAADTLDLDALMARLSSDGVPHAVRHVDLDAGGHPSDAILAVAAEVSAELLVIGLHRRSSVGKISIRRISP